MHKFFVPMENVKGDHILILGDDVQHISKVLRLRQGEGVLVSDGNNNEYQCQISDISKKEVTLRILKTMENRTEPPVEITLYQGIPKAAKMDLIIQKCVEIGVSRIQPVITDRVVVKLNDKDNSNKIERWQRIAEEASKQSNRGIIPVVENPVSFKQAIEELKTMDLAVIPYENEEHQGLKGLLRNKSEVKCLGIFIGPEGGFDPSEIDACIENNIKPVTLGPRILRTETAGFVALTIVLYELGDMGGAK